MKIIFFIFFSFYFSLDSYSQEKKKIDIKNADFTYINNEKHPDYWRLLGNVNIFHNKTNMYCDSAHYYSQYEKIIAFSNVKIIKDKNLNLYGEKLNYDGENNIAIISKNVVLINNKKIDYLPFEDNEKLTPVYEELSGWDKNLMEISDLNEAPKEVHDYIEYLENQLKVPIKIISVGPDRKQTLFR